MHRAAGITHPVGYAKGKAQDAILLHELDEFVLSQGVIQVVLVAKHQDGYIGQLWFIQ